MRIALLLAPLAVLLAALPTAPASPLACEGECFASWIGGVGFLPPVLVVKSGATVTWGSTDPERHVNIEGAAMLGQDECFATWFDSFTAGSARFEIADGELLGGNLGDPLAPCTTATFTPTGDAVLHYHCVIHPTTMRGVLVVEP